MLNTDIISSRLNTLFPEEVNDMENTLLQTIYIPKKLTHLTDRLPKSTYDDYEGTESGAAITRYIDNQEEPEKLPKLSSASQKIKSIVPHSVKAKDTGMSSGKLADYSLKGHTEK